MNLKTKEITLDDFKAWSGIDLAEEMLSTEGAQALLDRVSYRMESFVDSTFYTKMSRVYQGLTDYQKEHYKHALMEQLVYVFHKGDLSASEGKSCEIAPYAKRELILAGIWNGEVLGRRGFGDGFFIMH